MDCRDCKEWFSCPCGKPGHDKGTSIGYDSGNCSDYKEIDRPILSYMIHGLLEIHKRDCDLKVTEMDKYDVFCYGVLTGVALVFVVEVLCF